MDLQDLIKISWELHDAVEQQYLNHPAGKSDENWLEKQRFLLADMALHLLQTAIKPDELDTHKLKDSLYSILTISDQFLDSHDLRSMAEKIYDQ